MMMIIIIIIIITIIIMVIIIMVREAVIIRKGRVFKYITFARKSKQYIWNIVKPLLANVSIYFKAFTAKYRREWKNGI